MHYHIFVGIIIWSKYVQDLYQWIHDIVAMNLVQIIVVIIVKENIKHRKIIASCFDQISLALQPQMPHLHLH